MADVANINWNNFKGFQGKAHKGFEELCYQLANSEQGSHGVFTSIDDSGGGDGVEFYLTLPNGQEWGWQCKYYEDLRLNRGNRKTSIINSLLTATSKHPNLVRWHICLISDLTPEEQAWFDNTLATNIPSTHPGLEIKLVGESELLSVLSKPESIGIRNFFFGELELNLNWFSELFNQQFERLKEKYDNDLHVDMELEQEIHKAAINSSYLTDISDSIGILKQRINILDENKYNLVKYKHDDVDWGDTRTPLIDYINEVTRFAKKQQDKIAWYLEELSKHRLENFTNAFNRNYIDELSMLWNKRPDFDYEELNKRNANDHITDDIVAFIQNTQTSITNVFNSIELILKEYLIATKSDFSILGERGTGKTHLLTHLIKQQIENRKLGILLPAVLFKSTSSLKTQLLEILDIPRSYNWDDFVSALDIAAKVFKSKILICIDGLNEATYSDGHFNEVWKNDLESTIRHIESKSKQIVVVVTARSSYRKAIWPEGKDNFYYITGFNEEEAIKAQTLYFKKYKIIADFSQLINAHFQEPIFLKLYCEAKNAARQQPIEVHLGEQDVYSIVEEYTKQLNTILVHKIGRTPGSDLLKPLLRNIAEYQLNNNSRVIELSKFRDIVEEDNARNVEWDKSVSKQLINEGLFFYKDWQHKTGEYITFNYDLISGYFIADYIVELNEVREYLKYYDKVITLRGPFLKLKRAYHKAVNRKTIKKVNTLLKRVLNNDFQNRHPVFEDIIKALVILFPMRTDHYIQDLIDNVEAHSYAFEGLFNLPSEKIRNEDISWIRDSFQNVPIEKLEYLFSLFQNTWSISTNPLNSSFFLTELSKFTMSKRDQSWSLFIIKRMGYFSSLVQEFEVRCRNFYVKDELLSKARLHNVARVVSCLLVSSHRLLRDSATKSLYWYGRLSPLGLHALVSEFISFNDLYPAERLLASQYGVALALHKEFDYQNKFLPTITKDMYSWLYAKDAAYSTTHILIRDYSLHTIKLGIEHDSNILNEEEKTRLSRPFIEGGLRVWQKVNDEYREHGHSGPIHMDFGNYTVGRIANYDAGEESTPTAIRQQLYWRIYNLGYDEKGFERTERELSKARNYTNDKIDRLGKKYSWIAYFELAGLYEDKMLLNKYHYESYRFSEVDIDPSFPTDPVPHNIIETGLTCDDSIDTYHWLYETNVFDHSTLLLKEELNGLKAKWVLLYAHFSEEDTVNNRLFVSTLSSICVKEDNLGTFIKIIDKQKPHDLVDIPNHTYHVFHGEVPLSDVFPETPETEESLLAEEFITPIIFNSADEWKAYNRKVGFLSSLHLPKVIEFPFTYNKESRRYSDICIQYIVRDVGWENHEGLEQSRRYVAPTKELVTAIKLHGRPQEYSYYDGNNDPGILHYSKGNSFSKQEFLYIKAELLNQFLAQSKLEMVWVYNGDKRLWNKDDYRASDQFYKQYGKAAIVYFSNYYKYQTNNPT